MTLKRTLCASMIIGLVVGLATLISAQSNLPNPHIVISSPLDGTWTVTVTPTGPDAPPPFVNVATFFPDGKLASVDVDGTTGLGEWIRVGNRQYALTFVGPFLLDGHPVNFKVRGNITLSDNSDQFTGPFQTDVFDAAGNKLFSIVGTVNAKRVRVEPMS